METEPKTREEILETTNSYSTKSGHTRRDNLSEEDLNEMREWTTTFGKLMHASGFELFTPFISELAKIRNARMAVVSSGSSIYIKPILENCGVRFSPILTFEDHHSKEEKVEMVCREWGVGVRDVYFFTDTISDVAELENLLDRSKIYGCAWGYQGRERLLTVLDGEHVLANFKDVHKIA